MKTVKFLVGYCKFLWIFVIVGLGWQLLEIEMVGKINPNEVDTYISIVLSLSIYKNIENQKWFEAIIK